MTRPDFTYSLYLYDVQSDGGTVEARTTFLNVLGEFDWDYWSIILPFNGYKAGKLYYPDLRSQPHYAFVQRVEADGGTVEAEFATAIGINTLLPYNPSLVLTTTGYKAGVLYSAIPNINESNANIANASVTSYSGLSNYRISDTPLITADRIADDEVNIAVFNRISAYSVRIHEADGFRNNFVIDSNINSNSTIVTVDDVKDYKFKVSYFVVGNVNSVATEYEGTRSPVVYLERS